MNYVNFSVFLKIVHNIEIGNLFSKRILVLKMHVILNDGCLYSLASVPIVKTHGIYKIKYP